MINVVREGHGPPLLLVHGLGGSWRSWDPILPALADHREVVAVDLPGHGASPAEADSGTFAGLAASLERFILAGGMENVAAVGSSMGARLVLEMSRRGRVGAAVALDPGGFWRGWERSFFGATIGASIKLVRALAPAVPAISRTALGRTALLAQLSAKPWALSPNLVAGELKSFAATQTFDALVHDLSTGPEQTGPAAPTSGPVTIGWGRQDRLCLPSQAKRAMAAFPGAAIHWFEHSGHFPLWDQPDETVRVILDAIR